MSDREEMLARGRCEICGKEEHLRFVCNYCGGSFCSEHHLPENHNCASLPRIAPPYIRFGVSLSKEALDELKRLKNVDVRQSFPSKFRIRKVRKIVVGFLKVLVFSIFTIATMLPTILYLVMMTLPEYQSTFALLYVFRSEFLLWNIIIPNLGYLIAWVVVVYKLLRKRGKWWYYLILLGFGLWNWWCLLRVMLISAFFGV